MRFLFRLFSMGLVSLSAATLLADDEPITMGRNVATGTVQFTLARELPASAANKKWTVFENGNVLTPHDHDDFNKKLIVRHPRSGATYIAVFSCTNGAQEISYAKAGVFTPPDAAARHAAERNPAVQEKADKVVQATANPSVPPKESSSTLEVSYRKATSQSASPGAHPLDKTAAVDFVQRQVHEKQLATSDNPSGAGNGLYDKQLAALINAFKPLKSSDTTFANVAAAWNQALQLPQFDPSSYGLPGSSNQTASQKAWSAALDDLKSKFADQKDGNVLQEEIDALVSALEDELASEKKTYASLGPSLAKYGLMATPITSGTISTSRCCKCGLGCRRNCPSQ